MPDKQQKRFIVPALTNSNGITQFNFPFSAQEVCMAIIEVEATRGDLDADTTTSFRVCW
jgi:hypothetical protein